MKLNRVFWVLVAMVLSVLNVNCSAAKFESSPAAKIEAESGSGEVGLSVDVVPGGGVNPSVPVIPEEIFETRASFNQTQSKPVDLVWVIDNSGSMKLEAAHVRSNFAKFIESVKARTDLKVGLISALDTLSTGVTMPVTGPNYLQIVETIDSNNGPRAVASAFCPKTPADGSACKAVQTVKENLAPMIARTAGKLEGFLRRDSQKAFVFVTDDESSLHASQFRAAFREAFPGQEPVVYSFAGFSLELSPCRTREGLVYQALARETGGAVFNVCDADWSPTFERLANKVISIANQPIVLPDAVRTGKILSVEIDGAVLSEQMYSVTAQGLVIDDEITKSLTTATIKIRYTK